MLDETPANLPKASGVWEDLKEMIESLGGKPHCEYVSPVKSIPDPEDETIQRLRSGIIFLLCLLNKCSDLNTLELYL